MNNFFLTSTEHLPNLLISMFVLVKRHFISLDMSKSSFNELSIMCPKYSKRLVLTPDHLTRKLERLITKRLHLGSIMGRLQKERQHRPCNETFSPPFLVWHGTGSGITARRWRITLNLIEFMQNWHLFTYLTRGIKLIITVAELCMFTFCA